MTIEGEGDTRSGSSKLTLLREYTRAMGERIASLRARVHEPEPEQVLAEALFELDVTREELNVADEELSSAETHYDEGRRVLESKAGYYQDLFESAPDGQALTDAHGLIREANRAMAVMLGMRPAHLAGKPLVNFVAREDARAMRNATRAVQLAKGDTVSISVAIRPRDGRNLFVAELAAVGVSAPGEPVRSIRWCARRAPAREESTERSSIRVRETQGTIVAVVDRLRAALRACLGASTDRARLGSYAISRFLPRPSPARALRLADDLADYLAMTTGTFALVFTEANASRILENAVDQERSQAELLRVGLPVIEPSTEGELVCDAPRLTRVLSTLIAHVLMASPPGRHAAVSVDLLPDHALFCIGEVASPVTLATALPPSADEKLALDVAREILEAHHGTFTSGPGPAFTLSVPLTLAGGDHIRDR